jgi:hypothetical protein
MSETMPSQIPGARLALLVAAIAVPAFPQGDLASLLARDEHEGLLVAADPYTDPARARQRFGKKTPLDAGIAPIEVFFRNDNDKPIMVGLERIRLLLEPPGGERQQLEPLPMDDVLEQMLHKQGPDATMPRTPLPRTKPKSRSKEYRELEAKLRPMTLEGDLLPPRTTVHGFLYFQVASRSDWARHARLYLPDLKFMHNKQPLFYYELDLSKAIP